jgi:AraC family transcriptional regulator, arabinose operon regulatory protein
MKPMRRADGFPNETLITLPVRDLHRLESERLTRDLFLTDLGFFPAAVGHYRRRSSGCPQNILILCAEGRGFCRAGGGRRIAVGPMDLVLLREGVPHEYGADEKEPWTIFWVHFRGLLAEAMLGEAGGSPVRRLSAERMDRAQKAFLDLLSLVRDDVSFGSPRLVSGALWWLVSLLTEPSSEGEGGPWASPEDRALDLMRSRLSDPPTLSELASAAKLSPAQLTSRFRRRTGYPPLAYFTRLRMLRACALLDDPVLRVSEVAERLGYDDPLHFSRVFRRVLGVPPMKYRSEPRG